MALKARTTVTAAALALISLAIAAAQTGLPSPPRNLRILATELADADPVSPPPPPCAIPAASGGPHAYFDSLVRRQEHLCNWSLRSQAQLNSLTADKSSMYFTYEFGNDAYADPQDGAKFFRAPSANGGASVPIKQQLRMPLPRVESGSIILTWDWYWGREFRMNQGDVTHWKAFHVMVGGHPWWTLMHNLGPSRGSADPDEVAKVTDEIGPGFRANGMAFSERVTPSGPGTPAQRPSYAEAYPQYHSRWTRFWIEIRLLQPPSAFTDWSDAYLGGGPLNSNNGDPQGRWHMVSLWSADENRDVQRLLYRVPMNWKSEIPAREPYPTLFIFEMNSSKKGLAGPLIGYGRNVVLLYDYKLPATNPETDAFLFQRPRG
jgi:hypothetical protein